MNLEPRNPAEAHLLDYLTKIRQLRNEHRPAEFKYICFEDFVLQHGSFFTPTPLIASIRPMALGQCFENCFRVASRTKAFHYVEGFAIGVVPMHHAFVVDKDGCAYDPTWAAGKTGLGSAYVGVELDLSEVKKTRRAGTLALCEDYRRDFPILRGVPVLAKDGWFIRGA